jgi:hypothetical protein
MAKMQRKNLRSAAPKLAQSVAGLCLILLASAALAAPAGSITHLSGTVSAKRADGSKLLSIGSEIQEGDELATQRDTYARIKFSDGSEVVMRPETALKVTNYAYNEDKPQSDNMVLNLIRGGLRAVTGLLGKRNRDRFKLDTSTATIGIRGTHFGALLCADNCASVPTVSGQAPDNGLHVDVSSGAIVVTTNAGQQVVNTGEFGFVKNNLTLPIIRPPQDGVRVTMPPAISQNNAGGSGIGQNNQTQCAVQ